jgi:hypothetical protein
MKTKLIPLTFLDEKELTDTIAPETENRMEELLERIKEYHISFNEKPLLISANLGIFIVDQVVTHTP